MSAAKAVTDASFEADVLNSDKTILVDFWAEWCGPCRAVSPILDQIAAEHGDKIEIVGLVLRAFRIPEVVHAAKRIQRVVGRPRRDTQVRHGSE